MPGRLGREQRLSAGSVGTDSPIPMKISIVTVALNAAETIEDTLRSIASQTHPDVEHVIIDGGSRDATLDI